MNQTLLFTTLIISALAVSQASAEATLQRPTYDITRPIPNACYTQGLSRDDNAIWLSCGQYRRSKIYQLDAKNWSVVQQASMPGEWFAEGVVAVGQELLLLTWKNELVGRFNKLNLRQTHTQALAGEAWGLANTPDNLLLISDGSAVLRWLSPDNLSEQRQVLVTDGDRAVANLNELEWVGDKIWANVWQSDRIAIIEPASGQVEMWLDLSDISQLEHDSGGEVLNGILHLPSENAVYVTGKWWHHAYRLPLDQFKTK